MDGPLRVLTHLTQAIKEDLNKTEKELKEAVAEGKHEQL
jgi:hypothetical protein